jgi:hypothetical protein
MEETRMVRSGINDPILLDLMENGFAPSLIPNDHAHEHLSVYEVITGSPSPMASAVSMTRAIQKRMTPRQLRHSPTVHSLKDSVFKFDK